MRKVFMVLAGLILSACGADVQQGDEPFTVHAFKVGKADSFLLSQNGVYILIDAGEEDDGVKIVDYLKKHGIRKLEALIVTHFDKDHVGGANAIVAALDIKHIYVPDYESNSKQTKEFLTEVKSKNYTLEKIKATTDFTLGMVSGAIYPPLSANFTGDNDFSLIVTLQFGETSYLFAGDAEAPRLTEFMTKQAPAMHYTFLKVPHHGRYNAMTTSFVKMVQPKVALIMSSNKNPEDEETLQALDRVGAEVYTTREGDLEFESDGKIIEVYVE